MATKAHLECNSRYLEKFDDIKIRVPAGDRQKYKDFAAANGLSLNALVTGYLAAVVAGEMPLPPRVSHD